MEERHSVRAILLTEAEEILLAQIRCPKGGDPFWITPGGGLERGETVEEGLRRELLEELGLEGFDIGPLVWRRQHTFDWGDRRICQREEYYVVRVPSRFEPIMSDPTEAAILEQYRWWPTKELAHVTDPLTPLSLATIVARYLGAR